MDRTELPQVGAPAERADAARNRRALLVTARAMLAELGPERITMDALAERSGLGKGTVYRRFTTRAGIFRAVLDDDERAFQEQVLSGPPPLGPGAPAVERLVAYGQARVRFLIAHRDIARAALDLRTSRSHSPLTQAHVRMLLDGIDLGPADRDLLAVQLTGALDGPLLLRLSTPAVDHAPEKAERELADAWHDLIRRVCRPAAPD